MKLDTEAAIASSVWMLERIAEEHGIEECLETVVVIGAIAGITTAKITSQLLSVMSKEYRKEAMGMLKDLCLGERELAGLFSLAVTYSLQFDNEYISKKIMDAILDSIQTESVRAACIERSMKVMEQIQ